MKINLCEICGQKLIKYGKTSSGKQRWYCNNCKVSCGITYDSTVTDFNNFLDWLLNNKRLKHMSGNGRTFQRKSEQFWNIWPLSPIVDEIHKVIFVDGIYLTRNLVLLIACNEKYVLSWYLARGENSRSWGALLSRIAPPEMVVTDGGTGFRKACKKHWSSTVVQRCLFHVFCQIKRYTTSRPKLLAGKELYQLACQLLHVKDENEAYNWVKEYLLWESRWHEFLEERTIFPDNRSEYTHERLRSARSSINYLISSNTMFSFTNQLLADNHTLPSTNNRIEGAVNSQLRELLRNHRGLSTIKRAKACFWWCYTHTEAPKPIKEILNTMPTDESIKQEYLSLAYTEQNFESIPQWGDAIVWGEFHFNDPFRHDWD